MLTYALHVTDRYDGMVMATCPDVPEVVAVGRDDEEACEGALRALEVALEGYEAEGRDIPEPRAVSRVSVSTSRFGLLAPA
jgi:predicted RNase H-like HicB family nuclease